MSLVRRRVLAATGAVLLAGCASSVTVNCGGCPGDALVTTGLVRPGDAVTAIRVCVDVRCETEPYQRGSLVLLHLPTGQLHQLEVTTLDRGQVVRTLRATDLDVPAPRSGGGPCACHSRNVSYDPAHARLEITRT